MNLPGPAKRGLLRLLRRAGAKCPGCGVRIELPAGADDFDRVVACPECDRLASVLEVATTGMAPAKEGGAAVKRPADSKIVKRELKGGGHAWEIPASGRSGGLLGFAVVWLVFLVFITAGVVATGGAEDAPGLMLVVSAVFWAVGLWMLHAGLRAKYAYHLVIVDDRNVILARSLFGRKKVKSFPRSSITSVAKKVFYEQNYQPVFGIEIRGKEGKLRFGTSLAEEEKDWLVQEVKQELNLGKEEGRSGSGKPVVARREERFTLRLPRPKTIFFAALMFFLIGAGFVAAGVLWMKEAGSFRYMWIAISSLFMLIGLGAMVFSVLRSGTITEVVAMPGEVVCRRRRGRRVIEEESMRREELVAVRCYETGQVNGQPAYALELLGKERAISLVFFQSDPELPEIGKELAGKLGV